MLIEGGEIRTKEVLQGVLMIPFFKQAYGSSQRWEG